MAADVRHADIGAVGRGPGRLHAPPTARRDHRALARPLVRNSRRAPLGIIGDVKSITIHLAEPDFLVLRDVAARERREVRMQARVLVEREIERLRRRHIARPEELAL